MADVSDPGTYILNQSGFEFSIFYTVMKSRSDMGLGFRAYGLGLRV